MNRREFLQQTAVVSAGLALPFELRLRGMLADDEWRTFEVRSDIEILKASGVTRIWLPVPGAGATPYQKRASTTFDAGQGRAKLVTDPKTGATMVAAEYAAGVKPVLSVTSSVATHDYAVDLSRSTRRRTEKVGLARYLHPTSLLPTDGIVRSTAAEITRGATTDVDKARAIYDWIVANTYREPTVLGCGTGDIRFMLESKNLGGKCADLNALFVGLSRAAGLPARDVYGIRVAKSQLGYKSLGASSEVITKSQHCRAEVYLDPCGWTPVDPADVRKVILEEPPGNLPIDDPKATAARTRLFGSWEMNWIAYNDAHDVALPGSKRMLPFLMYPNAETADGPINSLDPDNFRYRITAREVGATAG
jgi:transglutaminase-like putative cysteine protease